MRPPSTQTHVLGSPPICLIAVGFVAFFAYYHWQGEPAFLPLAISIAFLLSVKRAHEKVQVYRTWKREWDAMSGVPLRPTRWARMVALLVFSVPLGLLFYSVWQYGGASALSGLGFLIIGPVIVIGFALKLLSKLLRRKNAKLMPVTICASRSILAKPSIALAYRHLPVHCRAILRDVR
jgi:hypothetical protein